MPDNELTLEILNKAINLIKKRDEEEEIVGFVLNPIDYENIKNSADSIWAITNGKLIVQSSLHMHGGFELYVSDYVPIGQPFPLRRKDARP